MRPVRPEFVPDPTLTRDEMESLQREIASDAIFEDDFEFDRNRVCSSRPATQPDGDETEQRRLIESETESEPPIVAGVDQAFLDDGDRAVSAIVAMRDGTVVERVHAVTETEIPYIPGLLSFREGNAILAAFEQLTVEPDLAFLDGSGRIHFRQAGLATHIGVMLDLPSIGVAKGLLCGTPSDSLTERLPEGTRIPIEAGDDVDTSAGTIIGYALQTRQYDSRTQSINPLYVSAGHRVSAETASDLVERCCVGYKLPEPTRQADAAAEALKRDLTET